jgi:DNA-binding MarR family transcriptional regulator
MVGPYYTLESMQAGNSIGYLVKRCGLLVTQIAERRFESQPITFTQWTLLAQLSQHSHLTPTELSKNLGHDMGALTRVVDDLEELKLVRRERSEHDRRAVRITVTAEGRRLAKTTMPVVVDLANELVAPYSKAETDLLISLLQRMLGRIERVAEQPAEERAAMPRPLAGRRRK